MSYNLEHEIAAVMDVLTADILKIRRCGQFHTIPLKHTLKKFENTIDILSCNSKCIVFCFIENPMIVIKIGTWMNDSWLDYADYCIEHAGESPHLMKFHDDVLMYEEISVYAAAFERLVDEEVLYRNDVMWLRNKAPEIVIEHDWKNVEGMMNQICGPIIPMAELLRDICITKRCNPDINRGNIMRRIDGTLVFTDPIA